MLNVVQINIIKYLTENFWCVSKRCDCIKGQQSNLNYVYIAQKLKEHFFFYLSTGKKLQSDSHTVNHCQLVQ